MAVEWERPEAAANMICQFSADDHRGWDGRAQSDQSVIVWGEAYVANPAYRAKLFHPKVEGSTAGVFLTMAENSTGEAPADGWWKVEFVFPDPKAEIRTVEIWCDYDTMLAEVPVRRD